jgi:hypothetical protein
LQPNFKGQRKFYFQTEIINFNDPKRTAGVVQNYIRQSGIRLLDRWPAQSAYLNPIENLWTILDLKLQSIKQNAEAELFEQLWQELDAGFFTRLADSMPSRIKKFIAPKGHIDIKTSKTKNFL